MEPPRHIHYFSLPLPLVSPYVIDPTNLHILTSGNFHPQSLTTVVNVAIACPLLQR